ncbi:hypothetical protein CGC20_33990 [Leishmania donovani]|uniref:Uncharacterized protein n=1 Tax=Leishmania donovani TaxID=5661 RepID=A0A504XF46_LEIDO|nr:hypothetical protein CGC20_33990 [Leishmania donovani]
MAEKQLHMGILVHGRASRRLRFAGLLAADAGHPWASNEHRKPWKGGRPARTKRVGQWDEWRRVWEDMDDAVSEETHRGPTHPTEEDPRPLFRLPSSVLDLWNARKASLQGRHSVCRLILVAASTAERTDAAQAAAQATAAPSAAYGSQLQSVDTVRPGARDVAWASAEGAPYPNRQNHPVLPRLVHEADRRLVVFSTIYGVALNGRDMKSPESRDTALALKRAFDCLLIWKLVSRGLPGQLSTVQGVQRGSTAHVPEAPWEDWLAGVSPLSRTGHYRRRYVPAAERRRRVGKLWQGLRAWPSDVPASESPAMVSAEGIAAHGAAPVMKRYDCGRSAAGSVVCVLDAELTPRWTAGRWLAALPVCAEGDVGKRCQCAAASTRRRSRPPTTTAEVHLHMGSASAIAAFRNRYSSSHAPNA